MADDVILRQLPPNVVSLVDPGFEEALYSSALPLLTSHLTAQAPDSKYTIPPPSHLALLVTMLVHPSTTNTPFRRQASHLLSRVLDVAAPRAAKFDQVFMFTRKRKRGKASDESEEEEEPCELENDSLFVNADNIWDVIEFAFMKGEGGWVDLLNLLVRILKNDFEMCKEASKEERDEAIDESILVQWLQDSGRKAAFAKAIRAIMATPGQEMMYDPPRGIYEDAKALPKKLPATGDIWGGNVLLVHRIDLLSMMHELATMNEQFIKPAPYLEAIERRLALADHYSVASFLLNIPSLNFRMILCECMANQLASELGKLRIERLYDIDAFAENVFQHYLPCLPPTGKEAAPDLMKYCIATGLLFRGWVLYTDGKTKYPEMTQIIDNAIRRREQRLAELRGDAKEEVKKVVGREGMFLKAFSMKVIRTRGGC